MVRRKLVRELGPHLATVLKTYSGLLRKWALGVLREFRARFESYADNYRAQAAAYQGGHGFAEGEINAIRSDLVSLGVNVETEGWGTGGRQAGKRTGVTAD
jgi:hypothetical protein